MELSDLKDGMVLTLEDGSKRTVFNERVYKIGNNYGLNDKGILKQWNKDLTFGCKAFPKDIIKVEYMGEEIWKREFKIDARLLDAPEDTKVLVSNDGRTWEKRYLKRAESSICWCFYSGKTSFTVENTENSISDWKYAKLYEEV